MGTDTRDSHMHIVYPRIEATAKCFPALLLLLLLAMSLIWIFTNCRSPDIVIVDSQVIADAPVEFLVAGMGDAMATYYEARAVERNASATTWIHPLTYRPPRIARAIAGEV